MNGQDYFDEKSLIDWLILIPVLAPVRGKSSQAKEAYAGGSNAYN